MNEKDKIRKFIRKTLNESNLNDNFYKWFAGSKVVDANGNPLVVHHGTSQKFSKFNFKNAGQKIIWFTSDKSAVEAGEVGAQGKGHIMDLYVSMKNPAGWDEYQKYGLGQLQGLGYDGAILPEGGVITGFVFEPNQVKSVSNKGEWDPSNKNIFKEDSSSSQILYPAKYMTGMEDVNDLERTMNKMFFYVDGKYTDESDKKKIAWANSVDLIEPIGVHIGQHGDVVFNDGHHRVLAARILNKNVPIIIENNRMKPEIFDVFMDRIKKGFTPVQINPDGVNLNYTDNYKIPSVEIMEQGRKLNTSRDKLFQFYMSKQDEEKSPELSEAKKTRLQPKPLSEKIFSQAEMVKMGGNYNLQHGMLMMIPVSMIDGLDPEPGSWLDDSGEEHDFEKGQKITKPIEVGYDEDNDVYMMWDGNHRVLQAKTNGDKYIKAFVQADSRDVYNGWKRLFNGSLNENNSKFSDDFDFSKHQFHLGDCDIYAVSLHRLYGYPLYIIKGWFLEPEWGGKREFDYESAHIVVKLPNGNYMDSDGEVTEGQLRQSVAFSNDIEKITFEPIDEETALSAFSCQDQEPDIKKVMNYIKSQKNITEIKLV